MKNRVVSLESILNHEGWQKERVPHHVYVKHVEALDEAAFSEIVGRHGGTVNRILALIRWRRIAVDPANINAMIAELYTNGHIINGEPECIYHDVLPNKVR